MKKIINSFLFILIVINILTIEVCLGQWVKVSNGLGEYRRISSIIEIGNILYAGVISYPGGVWMSTNQGGLWTQTSLNNQDVHSLSYDTGYIYAGTINNGIFRSTNNGVNWTQTSLNNRTVRALLCKQDYVYAGATSQGIFISTNNGNNWGQTSINNQNIYALASSGDKIFAGSGHTNGVYISTDNGANWVQTTLNDKTINVIFADGNNVYAGTFYGIYRTTNNGNNWSFLGLDNISVYSIYANGNNIIAGTDALGVYSSTNNGANWITRNEGLVTNDFIYTMLMANNNIYAGLWGTSVWRRPFSELTSSVQNISTEIPKEYSLSQNFPNPFNSSSIIRFKIKDSRIVTLKAFNMTGKEVAELVNEKLAPGTYEAVFNGSNLASGIYFYRIITNDFVETKKMTLIK